MLANYADPHHGILSDVLYRLVFNPGLLLTDQNVMSGSNREVKISPSTLSIYQKHNVRGQTGFFRCRGFFSVDGFCTCFTATSKTISFLGLMFISCFVHFQNLLARELLTPPFHHCWSNSHKILKQV